MGWPAATDPNGVPIIPPPENEPRRTYGFDMQGTLVTGDLSKPRPEIIEIARALVASGNVVYVVSSANIANQQLKPLEVVRDLVARFRIPTHGVYLGYFEHGEEEGRVYRAGQAKAAKMRELGIGTFFDDLPDICRAIKDAGLSAIQV